MKRAPTHRILENLFLVDLDLPLRGFRNFISSWILKADDRAMVIDPGPSATVAVLCDALRGLEVDAIDYVLLTHIHLDHAGGCGDLIRQYPGPLVVCHPQAVDHLANPERLWHGSVKVLGDLARTYGKPSPVRREVILPGHDISWNEYRIQSLETPGHASHHMSFFLEDIVLAGEAAGVRSPSENRPYTRPATPPPFQPEVALRSISLLIERSPKRICYGHYGMMDDAVNVLENARDQIRLWLEIIEARRDKGLEPDEEEIFGEILARDPAVRSFHQMEPNIRERETYFIKNSIKGMVGFVNARS
jgi:glyoxylase-like metal-dependent hydrolase (beta-lactamase superfamily II)